MSIISLKFITKWQKSQFSPTVVTVQSTSRDATPLCLLSLWLCLHPAPIGERWQLPAEWAPPLRILLLSLWRLFSTGEDRRLRCLDITSGTVPFAWWNPGGQSQRSSRLLWPISAAPTGQCERDSSCLHSVTLSPRKEVGGGGGQSLDRFLVGATERIGQLSSLSPQPLPNLLGQE